MENKTSQIKFLLNDISKGQQSSFKLLYAQYYQRIIRYLLMFVKSEEVAKELMNDIFIVIWKQKEKLISIDNFDAYIYRISKYVALNYLRSVRHEVIEIEDTEIDLFARTTTTPENKLISSETVRSINEAIENLPPRCKLIFKLVREDKMKYKEVSNHLNISVKTVENQLIIATGKIREVLIKKGI